MTINSFISHSHSHSFSLSHTHTLSLSETHTLSLSHTHTLSLSLSHTHTHTHTLSLSVSLSLTHTHTHLQTGGLLGNNHQVVIVALTLLLAEFLQLWRQVRVAHCGTQAVLMLLLHKST